MKYISGSDLPFIPSSHEDPQNPQVIKKVLLEKLDLMPGRVQMVNWAQLKPHASFNPHYHEDMAEVFLIIEGSVEMTINKEKIILERGDAVVVEPGEIHTMYNPSDNPIEYIVFGISEDKGGKTVVVS